MSERRDSNSRPSAWEANALPTELLSRENFWYYKTTPKNWIPNLPLAAYVNLRFAGAVDSDIMASPSFPPVTRRLIGLFLMMSGALLGLGLLLRVALGVYTWNTSDGLNASALLSVNLVGLLASGLLMRWGLRMRRGPAATRDPKANEIL